MTFNNFKYSFNPEELESSLNPIILTDSNGLIVWANENFKKDFDTINPIGQSFENYFDIKFQNVSLDKTFQEIQIDKIFSKSILRIIKIVSDKDESVFIIEVFNSNKDELLIEINNLLKILLDNYDLQKFSSNILPVIKKLAGSDKEIAVIIDNNNLKEIIVNHKEKNNINLEELSKVIKSNILTLNKWFLTYRKIFLSESKISSIAYQINQILETNYLYINAGISNNNVLALILFTKRTKDLTEQNIEIIKTFTNLFSIGIDLISKRENFKLIENQLANSQKLEIVGKLASGMAHDFNNLLASIFGSINLLKTRISDNENAIKLLDNIENCSIRARDLTKGILSFGKPTQQRKEIVFIDNVLNELIKAINETFPKYIKIDLSIDNSLYKIIGSSTEIYQILLNLCVNAKEAIKKEGMISLKADNLIIDDSNIFLFPFLDKGHFVRISVTDTGVGIDEENLSKIFEPYFSTKQKDTGSGLGLYVTSELVKAMNGYIEVQSKVNQGTTFCIYFPAVMIKEQKVINTKQKIIMLADDEEMLNELLGDLLESNGFYVLKVNNTNEVFRILSEEIKVDLLIIDYNLPEITGVECVTKLREMGFDMPVILASGASEFDSQALIKAKINNTLQKPYEFESILEIIKKLLNS